jgi:hypothetical protein
VRSTLKVIGALCALATTLTQTSTMLAHPAQIALIQTPCLRRTDVSTSLSPRRAAPPY